jgi:hypothetical protein
MTSLRTISRRSFLGRVAGGLAIGGGSLALLSGRAHALQRSVTDVDDGPINDPPSLGRGRRIARCNDTDTGPNSDPPRQGQGRGSGRTDTDPGPNSDPPNCGRN